MSDEEEVLCHKNDLCKHLNDLGYADFETFESNEQCQLDNTVRSKDFFSSFPSKSLNDSNLELTAIDSYNHDKITSLLKSKLLFLEDVKFVESVLSLCYVCDEKSTKYMIGAVATSFISMAAYFNRGLDSYFPSSCVAMSSIYAAWKLYKEMGESKRNKSVTLYIKSLQSLCIDFHKVLRFLKEVEILSTGQVSTQNVGSAMYIPVNSVNGLNELPPWKTLPDLRKSFANSLIDVINIFSYGCDYMNKFSPSWMDIEDMSSNSQVSPDLINVMFKDIKSYDGCISIKDLQILNDNYLIAQSEFLKRVAFFLCPPVWKNSEERFTSFKNGILMKYLDNTQTKICNISLKLKLSFDFQKVFTCPDSKDPLKKRYLDVHIPLSVDLKELKELQVELHQIFLLVLSTVQKAKNLEDCLDTFSSKNIEEKYVPINDLKETLSHQLSVVRNDLAQVVKDYDRIYCQILSKNKSVSHEDQSIETESTTAYQPQNDKPERIKIGYSDFAVSSPDEVFLAMSGSKTEDFEINPDDWCLERKPQIPQTLLTELSTTLKPIKKVFEERERLVLNKLGIKDIDNKEALSRNFNKDNPLNQVTDSRQCLSHKRSYDETQTEETSEHAENIFVQNEPVYTANSLLMADLLKMNLSVQHGKNLEEECFSDD